MINKSVKEAFDFPEPLEMEKLSTGLINLTFKATFPSGAMYLLQNINTNVFNEPDKLQQNYQKVRMHLTAESGYPLPAIYPTKTGDLLYKGEQHVWRCFEYVKDTYSPTMSETAEQAWLVASCFGKFAAKLCQLDPKEISPVLPGFHDLSLRFKQFLQALETASEQRKRAAAQWITEALAHQDLVAFYDKLASHPERFPLHILHHDCKIANILFKNSDHQIYCPIDLDTTQPGLFISDIGDMIRSMVPNYPENHAAVHELAVRGDFYEALREGYLETTHSILSKAEIEHIDMSGKLLVYMQGLRFLTDYLNEDIYYQISYPDQNLDRAANQLQLLKLLSEYLSGQKRVQRQYYTT